MFSESKYSSQRYRFYLTFTLLLLSLAVLPVNAAENIAIYPILPVTYSSVKVFDRDGRFVGRIMPETRYWTPIERIPVFLQNALVAVEDARFYEHAGIDVKGIARAMVRNVVKGRLAEGGSTITQQLIKNKFLSAEKTIDRKLKEGMMAVEFEQQYTKKQILEMYFNEIYYGNGAWGIAQASRLYFDKNPEALTEAEAALLAGIPKNPGKYNPRGEAAKVMGRRDVVLQRMVATNKLTAKQQKKLRAQRVTFTQPNQAPYYLTMIKNRLVESYGRGILETGGIEVTAALDLNLQNQAEKVLGDGVKKISPELQGALLSMDTATGDLLAVAGGVDFNKSDYNRALFAKRQPGSSIKPLIYATAVEKGITAASSWSDDPKTYSSGSNASWTPQNYGRERYGTLSLRQALAHSNNVIAVKLLETVGVGDFTAFAGKVGLPLHGSDLSLALGTEEVTLQELVQAYSPLANGGQRTSARSIIRILDHRTNSVIDYPPAVTPAITPEVAFITTSMLQDVLSYGTAKGLKKFSQERPAAGKTGTTDDYRDAWFIGYTPQIVTGVWVGHDMPRPNGRGFTGGAVAAPIWERFMRTAVATRPATDFPQPEDVIRVIIDPTTGEAANSGCPQKVAEFFTTATVPAANCHLHGGEPLQQPLEQLLPAELTAPPQTESNRSLSGSE